MDTTFKVKLALYSITVTFLSIISYETGGVLVKAYLDFILCLILLLPALGDERATYSELKYDVKRYYL